METEKELFSGYIWFSELGFFMSGNDKPYKTEKHTINSICNFLGEKDIFVYY